MKVVDCRRLLRSLAAAKWPPTDGETSEAFFRAICAQFSQFFAQTINRPRSVGAAGRQWPSQFASGCKRSPVGVTVRQRREEIASDRHSSAGAGGDRQRPSQFANGGKRSPMRHSSIVATEDRQRPSQLGRDQKRSPTAVKFASDGKRSAVGVTVR